MLHDAVTLVEMNNCGVLAATDGLAKKAINSVVDLNPIEHGLSPTV